VFAYKNGSYTVMILDDGTKIRYNKSNIYKPSRVESMDIKITNQCDMGCPMCHENSLPNGVHADVINNSIIDSIPPYTELAIGGGNPLSHPYLNYFLHKCKERKLIANITVNKKHFIDNFDFIFRFYNCNYINGIGISVFDITNEEIEMIKRVDGVCHVIIGVTPLEVMEKLAKNNIKVLVLGYKYFRRGENYYNSFFKKIDKAVEEWSNFISEAIKEKYYSVISFDNLAIKQLDLKSKLTEEEWDSFFMGDDGIDGEFSSASMYIDLVEGKFALNSCAPLDERYNCNDFGNDVNKMFNFLLKNS
jgi:hypothetical protein